MMSFMSRYPLLRLMLITFLALVLTSVHMGRLGMKGYE